MHTVYRDIFQAIHEGKWLSIQYRNKQDEITKYWISIHDLNVVHRTLLVEGLHLGTHGIKRFGNPISIDSILSSSVIESSYYPVNEKLISDIHCNPEKYKALFDHVYNLKVLNYLEDCNRMDTTPYYKEFELVKYLDRDGMRNGTYQLDDEQFRYIVKSFQKKAEKDAEKKKQKQRMQIQQLAMNVMSIHTPKGLYVLAYRKLFLDVKGHCLRASKDVTICTEFTIDGTQESIRRYLDGESYVLLQEFEKNQETIKDAVTKANPGIAGVDDMPYIIGLGMDIVIDLHREYRAIIDMYQNDTAEVPIKAFFGDVLARSRARKAVPIILLERKINLDQLLAIHNVMRYPLTYVQGPPGTGKTNTIINTVITAFFNNKSVLFTAYNNHPIDSVCDKLTSITYNGKLLPFPVLQLGNEDKIRAALVYMRELYERIKDIPVYAKTLDKDRNQRITKAKELSDLLIKYDRILELKERENTIRHLLEYQRQVDDSAHRLLFEANLKGKQLEMVERQIEKLGMVSDEEAIRLLSDDTQELKKYLYYTSVGYIKKIGDAKNEKLRNILYMEEEDDQLKEFKEYIKEKENLHRLMEIFPVMAVTCISAGKLATPEPHFDMVVMDEASQCNTAVGLVPIIRGKNLMLVGDPQQLNPVILLDELTNKKLRKKYEISDEYDYRRNSIYKTYLACDSVSDEILLKNHYRCNKKIIDFNNKKYYNSKLQILSQSKEKAPLVYVDVSDAAADYKNTAPAEAEEIVRYAALNQDKTIGVITPFVNQKNEIERRLKESGLKNVSCGTVHAFQGDEKDVVLFSTAITDDTHASTYQWLKNNQELINVATSRAREKLIVLSNSRNLERLHHQEEEDDLYDLVQYVKSNGQSSVTPKKANSRALGVKPFSAETEEAFLRNLTHALDNIWLSQNRFTIEGKVRVADVFKTNIDYSDLFYNGHFDFVVYEQRGKDKYPVLVIELDGREHVEDEIVRMRDEKKQKICESHQMQLIRVENTYARRYQHMKSILERYFKDLR